jgi:hypothetical protein
MKNLFISFIALTVSVFGQTALTQTATTAAMTSTQQTVLVSSATGISAGTALYILDPGEQRGELVQVKSNYSSGTTLPITRGSGIQRAHTSGAVVVIAPVPAAFYNRNPYGACTASETAYTPWINTDTGEEWLCSTITLSWVPGFNNPSAKSSTATVASAASAITPSGPLFTVSGTAAVTGFNIPVGFSYSGGFCVAPTGAFTWTTAGNIGLAGTAVVGRVLCFTWNNTSSKWLPSYV